MPDTLTPESLPPRLAAHIPAYALEAWGRMLRARSALWKAQREREAAVRREAEARREYDATRIACSLAMHAAGFEVGRAEERARGGAGV